MTSRARDKNSGKGSETRQAKVGHRGRDTRGSASDSDESSGYSSSTSSKGEESVESLVDSAAESTPRKKKPQVARSNKRGIELTDQKVLLLDIERFGGIDKVRTDITAFCDSQAPKGINASLLYGSLYSKERTRVENKIRNSWAKLSKAEYQDLLISFGILVPSAPATAVKVSRAGKVSSPAAVLKVSSPAVIPVVKASPSSKPSVITGSAQENENRPKSNPEPVINVKPATMSRFEVKDDVLYGKCFC